MNLLQTHWTTPNALIPVLWLYVIGVYALLGLHVHRCIGYVKFGWNALMYM